MKKNETFKDEILIKLDYGLGNRLNTLTNIFQTGNKNRVKILLYWRVNICW